MTVDDKELAAMLVYLSDWIPLRDYSVEELRSIARKWAGRAHERGN